MALAMFALCAFFLLIAAHPFVTYPLTLYFIRARGWRPRFVPTDGPQRMAICVCAYNEEGIIEQKAENLLEIKRAFPDTEIAIYVDGATDRTAEILSRYSDEFKLHISPQRYGKTHGMNLLVAQTTAPIVIFTDANVMVDVNSLRALPGYFSNPEVGCVCGHLKYVNSHETVTAQNGSAYWRLEEFIKTMESDTGSAMGADGSLFAIRRELHNPPPDDIIDDMFVSLSILCDGYRIVRAPNVIAYEKSVTSAQEEFRRKVRIACQAFNVHRLLWPRLRKLSALDLYKYISHKFIRWLSIYWLVCAALSFEAGMISAGSPIAGLIIIALGIMVLSVGVLAQLPIITQVADLISAFVATGLGVWRSLSGDHFQTWSPASSIRRA
ncbi:MAG TPA: glycosyltransferase [Rickettsiales bacterium]|nr:glycosyltransferase [Rickettsiales bacterium]